MLKVFQRIENGSTKREYAYKLHELSIFTKWFTTERTRVDHMHTLQFTNTYKRTSVQFLTFSHAWVYSQLFGKILDSSSRGLLSRREGEEGLP